MPGRRTAGPAVPMPPDPGIGAELRALRSGRGMGLRAAARRLGWSAATLSRTENGLRAVDADQVEALLRVYEVTGPRRDRLLALARETRRPGWWEAVGSTGVPGAPVELATLIGLEARATRIIEVQLALIPGLLQTPEYTRALMRAAGVRGPDIETRVAMRLGRQAILTRSDPLEYVVLLDEAVLRRPVGGPAVFARQLRQVVELSRRPTISVQVIPYDYGAHAALTGAHLILEFAEAPTIVHLEHRRASVFLDRPEDVRPFVTEVDTLRFTALDPGRSARFIAAAAAEHEQSTEEAAERAPEVVASDGQTAPGVSASHATDLDLDTDTDTDTDSGEGHGEHEASGLHEEHEEHALEKIRSKWHGNRLRRGEFGTSGRPG